MKTIVIHAAVYAAFLSFPAAFLAGHYFLAKRGAAQGRSKLKRWAAASAYSAAVFLAWWAVYFWGRPLQNVVPLPHLAFAYSLYALLPVAAVAGAAALTGTLVCAMRKDAK